MFTSSLLHYPALTRQVSSNKVVRNPAHSDFGTLTLLFQRDVGGLQVADMGSTNKTSSAAVDKSARFLDVEPDPHTILVNAGYLLMRWTNRRYKNTVHRVSEPPPPHRAKTGGGNQSESIPQRYSVAFFSFPDADTDFEPLSSCCSDEVPKKWNPINAGEYLARKRKVAYSLT